jgi:hypothetical protein
MNLIEYSAGDLVEIIWNDIVIEASWTESSELDETPDESICKSVGYFVIKNKHFIILAATSGVHDSALNGITYVPIGCITEHRKLS